MGRDTAGRAVCDICGFTTMPGQPLPRLIQGAGLNGTDAPECCVNHYKLSPGKTVYDVLQEIPNPGDVTYQIIDGQQYRIEMIGQYDPDTGWNN